MHGVDEDVRRRGIPKFRVGIGCSMTGCGGSEIIFSDVYLFGTNRS